MKSYKELQATLKDFRDNYGYELTCKLNAKKATLQAEYVRIMDLAGDDGTLETIANEVDAANSEQTVTWFSQEEPKACSYPEQQVEDFLDREVYADTATQTPELESLDDEVLNTTLDIDEPVLEPLAFNHATNALMPMQLILWTLAVILIPATIVIAGLKQFRSLK